MAVRDSAACKLPKSWRLRKFSGLSTAASRTVMSIRFLQANTSWNPGSTYAARLYSRARVAARLFPDRRAALLRGETSARVHENWLESATGAWYSAVHAGSPARTHRTKGPSMLAALDWQNMTHYTYLAIAGGAIVVLATG